MTHGAGFPHEGSGRELSAGDNWRWVTFTSSAYDRKVASNWSWTCGPTAALQLGSNWKWSCTPAPTNGAHLAVAETFTDVRFAAGLLFAGAAVFVALDLAPTPIHDVTGSIVHDAMRGIDHLVSPAAPPAQSVIPQAAAPAPVRAPSGSSNPGTSPSGSVVHYGASASDFAPMSKSQNSVRPIGSGSVSKVTESPATTTPVTPQSSATVAPPIVQTGVPGHSGSPSAGSPSAGGSGSGSGSGSGYGYGGSTVGGGSSAGGGGGSPAGSGSQTYGGSPVGSGTGRPTGPTGGGSTGTSVGASSGGSSSSGSHTGGGASSGDGQGSGVGCGQAPGGSQQDQAGYGGGSGRSGSTGTDSYGNVGPGVGQGGGFEAGGQNSARGQNSAGQNRGFQGGGSGFQGGGAGGFGSSGGRGAHLASAQTSSHLSLGSGWLD